MITKIEAIKGKMVTENDFEKFRKELKGFAETYNIKSVSTAIGSSMAGASTIVATILYEVEQ